MIHRSVQSFARILRDSRVQFVTVNVGANLLFFVRSAVALWVLDYRGLGLVALLQSVVMLLGLFQFGFLNGGYRLLCSASGSTARDINNLLYSFMAALSLAALAIGLGALPLVASGSERLMIVLGVIGGAATLVRNWQTNQLIVAHRLVRLNALTLWSALASVASLGLILVDPLLGCMAPIVVNPVLFVALTWALERDLRPTAWHFDPARVRQVLDAGFMVFLSGILIQLNAQFERWYVAGDLGLEQLGHLTLAVLYATVFQLVPTSLNAIYLPRLVQLHETDAKASMRASFKRYFLITLAYCAAAAVATIVLMPPLVSAFLPKYLGDTRYVLILIPGLVFLTLAGVHATAFSILIQYRMLTVAYVSGTALFGLALGVSALGAAPLSLTAVEVWRSVSFAVTGLILWVAFAAMAKKRSEFGMWVQET